MIRPIRAHSCRSRVGATCTQLTFLILLTAFWSLRAPDAAAQFEQCPFTADAAIADTLDPSGYYPLETGHAWEYVRWAGCCLDRASRHEVIGDTLIDGESYQTLRVTNAFFDGVDVDPRDSSSVSAVRTFHRYVSVDDGVLVEWKPGSGERARRDLGLPFQSCGTDEASGALTVVWALPTAAYELNKGGEGAQYQPAAGKGMDVGGEQFLYQYGVGYVSGEAGDSIEVMTFASIDEMEFGDPLTEIFGALYEPPSTPAEPPELPEITEFGLVNYPNPFAAQTNFKLALPEEGMVTLQVVDLLGRRVARPLDQVSLTAGEHVIEWRPDHLASGIYFVQLIHDGRVVESRSVVMAR